MNSVAPAATRKSEFPPLDSCPDALEALEYTAALETVWEELVARARNGHFMATRRFLNYHGDRFQDRSLLFMRNGKALAAIALHQEGPEWISHRGVPFGGLLAAPELTTEQTAAIFQEIFARMRAANINGLRYSPAPSVYQTHPFEDDIFVLHSQGARLLNVKLAARARLPELLLMQERARKYVRQAVPHVKVEHDVALGEFWDHLTGYLRHRHEAIPVHTKAEMADLIERFPDAIKLLAIRDLDGRIVAGSLVFLTEHVIRLQYSFGAADPAAPKSAILALDQAAIRKFGPGRSWIDFGTSMRPMDGLLDLQLHSQKERCGGRGMRVETWLWTVGNGA
ncbi:MAG: GNAT family N-acetyltransferase [Verrucomicrobiota bacterium]